jgi:hypothetical protein
MGARSQVTAVGWKGLPTFVLGEARVTRDPDGLVQLPYFTASGELHNTRVFAPGGRTWWAHSGRGLLPFGLDRLTDPGGRPYRSLAIAEGESDALALDAAFGADLFDVLGVPGSTVWRPEWAGHAADYAAIYVFGDGDPAGRAFNWRVRRTLPSARIVEIPDGQDARSMLQNDRADELLDLIDAADELALLEHEVLGAAA